MLCRSISNLRLASPPLIPPLLNWYGPRGQGGSTAPKNEVVINLKVVVSVVVESLVLVLVILVLCRLRTDVRVEC